MNLLRLTGYGVISDLNAPLLELTTRQHIVAIGFVSLITIWAISIEIKYQRKNKNGRK